MLLIHLFFLPLLLTVVAYGKPTNPKKYRFNHTTMRIKDPKVSLKFYTEVLGMKYITSLPLESRNMTLYFVSHVDEIPKNEEEKKFLVFNTPGVVELMHMWGTEKKA
ncbi:hypothetical protein BY458DRAFT_585924 [Sporodiniella umbellata]|nr:hypothetical protein BY458DRAFT_585924 [Sporodiniella umbellata]